MPSLRTVPGLLVLTATCLIAEPPKIDPGGIISATNALHIAPAAPGSLISIYGTNLASATAQASTEGDRLPTDIGGTQVRIGGLAAPLLYVSPRQINAMVPFEVAASAQPVTVTTAEGTSLPELLAVTPVAPAIFSGAVVKNADFSVVSEANPARPGDVLVAFCTGLGQIDPPIQSGSSLPSVLSHSRRQPQP